MEPKKQERAEKDREELKEDSKKPYETPKLSEFGPVERLTGIIAVSDT